MGNACVIFDCDGTLVETESLESAIFAAMLRAEGYPVTDDEAARRFRGTRKDDILRGIERELGRSMDRDAFVSTWRERSEAIFSEKLELVPGAMDLIRSLTLPYCIASNGPLSKMNLTLRLTGLQAYFEDRVFSAYEVGSHKPDPGLFLHAASQMDASPTDCIVVEDSEPGVLAGLAAGMHVIAYQPDPTEAPLAAGVSVIRHLSEVSQFLEQP